LPWQRRWSPCYPLATVAFGRLGVTVTVAGVVLHLRG
jgi:hypothetical protein